MEHVTISKTSARAIKIRIKIKMILFVEILFSSSTQYETVLEHGFSVLVMWYVSISGFSRG
jgi:hypothetical protein